MQYTKRKEELQRLRKEQELRRKRREAEEQRRMEDVKQRLQVEEQEAKDRLQQRYTRNPFLTPSLIHSLTFSFRLSLSAPPSASLPQSVEMQPWADASPALLCAMHGHSGRQKRR